ncbi:unnamed protein product, partial [Staurois parvus]
MSCQSAPATVYQCVCECTALNAHRVSLGTHTCTD